MLFHCLHFLFLRTKLLAVNHGVMTIRIRNKWIVVCKLFAKVMHLVFSDINYILITRCCVVMLSRCFKRFLCFASLCIKIHDSRSIFDEGPSWNVKVGEKFPIQIVFPYRERSTQAFVESNVLPPFETKRFLTWIIILWDLRGYTFYKNFYCCVSSTVHLSCILLLLNSYILRVSFVIIEKLLECY